jgi:hypothetical protein
MATIFAVKNGAWNDPSVWDTGVTPIATDTVGLNECYVTIYNLSITCVRITMETTTGVSDVGGLVTSNHQSTIEDVEPADTWLGPESYLGCLDRDNIITINAEVSSVIIWSGQAPSVVYPQRLFLTINGAITPTAGITYVTYLAHNDRLSQWQEDVHIVVNGNVSSLGATCSLLKCNTGILSGSFTVNGNVTPGQTSEYLIHLGQTASFNGYDSFIFEDFLVHINGTISAPPTSALYAESIFAYGHGRITIRVKSVINQTSIANECSVFRLTGSISSCTVIVETLAANFKDSLIVYGSSSNHTSLRVEILSDVSLVLNASTKGLLFSGGGSNANIPVRGIFIIHGSLTFSKRTAFMMSTSSREKEFLIHVKGNLIGSASSAPGFLISATSGRLGVILIVDGDVQLNSTGIQLYTGPISNFKKIEIGGSLILGPSTAGMSASTPTPHAPTSIGIKKITSNKIQGAFFKEILGLWKGRIEEIDYSTNLNNFMAINGPMSVGKNIRLEMKGPANSKLVFVKDGNTATALVTESDLENGYSYGAITGILPVVSSAEHISGTSGRDGDGIIPVGVYTKNILGT